MDTNRRFALSALGLVPVGLGLWWLSPVRTAVVPEPEPEPIPEAKPEPVRVDQDMLDAGLEMFLASNIMTPAMRCGTRRGDGAPPFPEVEAYQKALLDLSVTSASEIADHVQELHHKDVEADRVALVDGWVMSDTELLSASLATLKQDQECILTP